MHPESSQSALEFLIVCKDAGVHRVVTEALHAAGATAHFTSDSASALAHITGRKLDGVFIDTRSEDALNLVGSVRRGSSNRFSVIFAVAREDEEVSRLLNAGVNFVVYKPLDSQELQAVLKSASQMIADERQRYLRHLRTVPVALRTSDKELKAVTINISRGGMALRCGEALMPGAAVEFVLDLPGVEAVHGRGEVAWSSTKGQMGVRFYLMEEDVKKTLWLWLQQGSGAAAEGD